MGNKVIDKMRLNLKWDVALNEITVQREDGETGFMSLLNCFFFFFGGTGVLMALSKYLYW